MKNDTEFGIQLWSVKEEMAKDPKGTLIALASYGYQQIETFEGASGMFWGMGAKGFHDYITDLGMELVAGHCDVFTDFEMKAEQAASIGMKYLICPWLGAQPSLDAYKKVAEEFNKCGEITSNAGIGFAYHNHDYSFQQINGVLPQDILMQETHPTNVKFEMDIYWVAVAGHHPTQWLEKYPNRWPLVHFKDKAKKLVEKKCVSTTLGNGTLDFQQLKQDCLSKGVNYILVEQEFFQGTTPMKAAELNAQYMRRL